MSRGTILVVDDEPSIRFGIGDYLTTRGFIVEAADGCASAEVTFRRSRPDAAVVDHQLGDGTALGLLPRLRVLDPDVPLIVLTAHASIDLAVEAVKSGADQFLTKPVELAALEALLARLIEARRDRQRRRVEGLRLAREALDPFLGVSAAVRALEADARRIAGADVPVVIEGETGSGKGVLARWLHQASRRAEEPFVDLNCAGLSREFLETELFGHEKGAFTGATGAKPGLLELAHRGTLFLDEIGDVDPQVQPKLLTVLEEHRFRRLGATQERIVDVRLMSATHFDLATLAHDQRFRRDLYFRIATVRLRVPPLRERPEDLPALARALLARIATRVGRVGMELTDAALRMLVGYSWPGNVRELRNVLERAVLLGGGVELGVDDLRFDAGLVGTPPAPAMLAPAVNAPRTLDEIEREVIEAALAAEGGNVPRAAARLGISRSSLYQKRKLRDERSSSK